MQSSMMIARTKKLLDDTIDMYQFHRITEPRSIMVDDFSVWVAYVTERLEDGPAIGVADGMIWPVAGWITQAIGHGSIDVWKVIRECETCVGKCLAGNLRVGMYVGGRRIAKLVQCQALGIPMVDWDFGYAETIDYVHDVTATR